MKYTPIFAAYWEAFTDSHHLFDDDFKQTIATLLAEWIAGKLDYIT